LFLGYQNLIVRVFAAKTISEIIIVRLFFGGEEIGKKDVYPKLGRSLSLVSWTRNTHLDANYPPHTVVKGCFSRVLKRRVESCRKGTCVLL